MKAQKSLRLKDYLRLTSLSNDAKYDKYAKSLSKNNKTCNSYRVNNSSPVKHI